MGCWLTLPSSRHRIEARLESGVGGDEAFPRNPRDPVRVVHAWRVCVDERNRCCGSGVRRVLGRRKQSGSSPEAGDAIARKVLCTRRHLQDQLRERGRPAVDRGRLCARVRECRGVQRRLTHLRTQCCGRCRGTQSQDGCIAAITGAALLWRGFRRSINAARRCRCPCDEIRTPPRRAPAQCPRPSGSSHLHWPAARSTAARPAAG